MSAVAGVYSQRYDSEPPSLPNSHPKALARLGANTTAIDASATNINVAKTHAALDPAFSDSLLRNTSPHTRDRTKHSLLYRHCAAEDLVKEGKQYDIVCAMEVIEHVDDPTGFLDCLSDLTKVLTLLSLVLASHSSPPPARWSSSPLHH